MQFGIMDTPQAEYRTYIVLLLNKEFKRMQDNNTLSPSPRSHLLLLPRSLPATTVGYQSLYQSILPTSTPLPFKYQALRWEPEAWEETCVSHA